jgi:hypothetical protein
MFKNKFTAVKSAPRPKAIHRIAQMTSQSLSEAMDTQQSLVLSEPGLHDALYFCFKLLDWNCTPLILPQVKLQYA